MLNPLQDKEFLKQLDTVKNKTIYIKITSLDQENKPLEVIEGKATGGSINVDGASAVRRSCSLTLITLQNENDITDVYWSLKHKFELEVGIENNINTNYPSAIWFKQGCYVINSFSKNNNTNNLTISISGQDKMALLNGSLGGSFTHEIDFGTEEEVDVYGDIITRKVPIYKIIKNALQVYAQESIENIVINDLDEYGWELWEYRGEKPLYYLYKTTDNDISNEVVSYINNPDTIVYVHQNDEIYESKISDIPQYYSLNTLDKDYNLTATQVAMRESDWRWEKEGENTIIYSFTNQLGKDIQDLYLNFNKNTNNSDNDLGYTFELSITNEYKNKYNFIFRADSLSDEDIKNNYTIDELKGWAGEEINVVFHKYDQYIDFNNDGEFNDKDVKLLSEYVAGYRGEEYEKVVVYGDINNDGEINLEDTRELIIKTLVTYDEVNKTLHVPYGARFWLVAQPTDKAIQGAILELTTTLPLDENRSKVFTMFNKDHKEETFYITKVDYGETAGYHKIDLVYNDDLILKAGENITTLLDKIKNMLGNFEYFYDINGKFIFQKKKNYLQELFSPINGNIVNPTMTISPYEYKFDNLENVVSFSNSSQINNMKNDFTIWGQKRNGVNQKPFHIRYAI